MSENININFNNEYIPGELYKLYNCYNDLLYEKDHVFCYVEFNKTHSYSGILFKNVFMFYNIMTNQYAFLTLDDLQRGFYAIKET